MTRDLLVSAFSPRLGNGRDLRTFTVIRALAAGRPLDLLYVPYGGEPDPRIVEDPNIALHEVIPSRGVSRLGLAVGMRALGWSWGIARSCSPELRSAALDLARSPDRGRIIAADLVAMALLLQLGRRRPVIYAAQNIESSYEMHTQRWRTIAALERMILETAAESWMVSWRDMRLAEELAPGATLRYVPNVVDVHAITPRASEPSRDHVALMVGDFTYAPNRQSATWLIEEVMPRVWAQLPDARIRLTGRALALSDLDPRIEVTGFVDDIAEAYAAASVVVVPLVEGAGTPLKFVEALAYGAPIVATPLAARGLDVVPGVHFRLGDSAEDFADALVDLLEHPDPSLGAAGRDLAEREYSLLTLERLLAPTPAGDAPGEPGHRRGPSAMSWSEDPT